MPRTGPRPTVHTTPPPPPPPKLTTAKSTSSYALMQVFTEKPFAAPFAAPCMSYLGKSHSNIQQSLVWCQSCLKSQQPAPNSHCPSGLRQTMQWSIQAVTSFWQRRACFCTGANRGSCNMTRGIILRPVHKTKQQDDMVFHTTEGQTYRSINPSPWSRSTIKCVTSHVWHDTIEVFC